MIPWPYYKRPKGSLADSNIHFRYDMSKAYNRHAQKPFTSFTRRPLHQAIHESLAGMALSCLIANNVDAQGLPGTVELSALNPSGPLVSGIVIQGISTDDFSGGTVSNAGDINADGIDDLLITARSATTNGIFGTGQSFLIFGATDLPTVINLSNLNGSGDDAVDGVAINGISNGDFAGRFITNTGDINGDGIDDFALSAHLASPYGNIFAGQTYIIFGATSLPEVINLSNLNGVGLDSASGVLINGIDQLDVSGLTISNVGDINTDGIDDLVISAPGGDSNDNNGAGEAYVLFGATDLPGLINLSNLNGTGADSTTGILINGIDPGDNLASSVSNAGDFNNDGIDDLIIGARDADPNLNDEAGETYLIFGSSNLPEIINMSSLNTSAPDAAAGIIFNGIDAGDHSGITVSNAGDFNSDGIDDILIGAYGGDTTNTDAGEAYVVFGSSDLPGAINLSALNNPSPTAAAGIVINGIDMEDFSGNMLSTAGDINHDGIDDIVISAFLADPNGVSSAGETYVIFGGTDLPDTINLSSLNTAENDSASGILLQGTNFEDFSGLAVNNAGDINSDGIDDLVVGAPAADPYSNSRAGETYILFGGTDLPGIIQLSNINNPIPHATAGVIFNGIDENDFSGRSVSNAGDINNDGIDDLLIGAVVGDPNGNSGAGETYLVYGTSNPPPIINLSNLNGAGGDAVTGVTINGIDPADNSAFSVSNLGDINGDDIDDLIIGADDADPNDNSMAGEVYVVFGATNLPDVINLSNLNGVGVDAVPGIVLNGIDANDFAGRFVSNAGDINNDGINDLVIGAALADPNDLGTAGETYLIYGATDFPGLISLSNINGSGSDAAAGIVINGAAFGDRSGVSVNNAGDINGDGIDDLLIGAFLADAGANFSNRGETYLIFGRSDLPGTINLSSINTNNPDGASGIVFNGIDNNDNSGFRVSNAGDTNGDGYDDLLIGARYGAPNGNEDAGETYLIFGASNLPETVELSGIGSAGPVIGAVINGADAFDFSSRSISTAGDINNDNFDDILIGAEEAGPDTDVNNGKAYLLFGTSSLPAVINLSNLNGIGADATPGVTFNGIDIDDYAGSSVSNAGDFNGDGIDDLLISATDADPNGNSNAGETYLIFGRSSSNIPPLFDLGNTTTLIINEDTTADMALSNLLSVNDPDIGNILNWVITSPPANGTLSGFPVIATTFGVNGTVPEGVRYQPSSNFFGSDTFTIQVSDGIGTASLAVNVTINSVNDAPAFTGNLDQTIVEDAGMQIINNFSDNFTAGPVNEFDQTLTFEVIGNSNPALFSTAPTIDGAGDLTYTPAADANGVANISIELMDDGGTANSGQDTSQQTLDINILPVNDPPEFIAGSDQLVADTDGALSIFPWASNITPGPGNENAQSVQFTITGNTNPSLFAALPSVAPDGTLNITPAFNQNGSAELTVILTDNGPADGSNQNTSSQQTFMVEVELGPSADLAITKINGIVFTDEINTIIYTIVASNLGSNDVINAVVNDVLPDTLDVLGASWTCTPSPAAVCTASGTGNINDTVNIPGGGQLIYTLTADVIGTESDAIINTAILTPPDVPADRNLSNNTATDSDPVGLFVDNFEALDEE